MKGGHARALSPLFLSSTHVADGRIKVAGNGGGFFDVQGVGLHLPLGGRGGGASDGRRQGDQGGTGGDGGEAGDNGNDKGY